MGGMPQPFATDPAASPPGTLVGVSIVAGVVGLVLFLTGCGILLWNEGRAAELGAGLGSVYAWATRVGAALFAVLGLAVAFKPLEGLVDRHPLCAVVAGIGTRIVALHLGLAVALGAVAVSWFPAQPIMAGVLAVGAVASLIALVLRARRQATLPAPPAPAATAVDVAEDRKRLRSQRQREALLMRAMILAARVDGALNGDEKATITIQARKAGLTAREGKILDEEMAKPLSMDQLVAACGEDLDLKLRVLAATLFIMRDENPAERAHFIALAKNLGLTPQHLVAVRRKIGR